MRFSFPQTRQKEYRGNGYLFQDGAFAKTHRMAKQKFRPTRLGIFSGAKAYSVYVEVLKK
jgi:hypothetical protein